MTEWTIFFPLVYINLFAERNSKRFHVYKYNGRRGVLVNYSGTFIKKIFKPQRITFSLCKIKLQLCYGGKKKRMDKTYILAGSESNRAKVLHLKIIQSSFQLTNTLSQRSSIAIWKGTEFFWTWAAVSPPWCPLTPEGMLGVVCVLQCFNLTLFNIILIFSPSSPWSL